MSLPSGADAKRLAQPSFSPHPLPSAAAGSTMRSQGAHAHPPAATPAATDIAHTRPAASGCKLEQRTPVGPQPVPRALDLAAAWKTIARDDPAALNSLQASIAKLEGELSTFALCARCRAMCAGLDQNTLLLNYLSALGARSRSFRWDAPGWSRRTDAILVTLTELLAPATRLRLLEFLVSHDAHYIMEDIGVDPIVALLVPPEGMAGKALIDLNRDIIETLVHAPNFPRVVRNAWPEVCARQEAAGSHRPLRAWDSKTQIGLIRQTQHDPVWRATLGVEMRALLVPDCTDGSVPLPPLIDAAPGQREPQRSQCAFIHAGGTPDVARSITVTELRNLLAVPPGGLGAAALFERQALLFRTLIHRNPDNVSEALAAVEDVRQLAGPHRAQWWSCVPRRWLV